jgi:hypothetical protein
MTVPFTRHGTAWRSAAGWMHDWRREKEGNGFFVGSTVPEPVPAASQRQPIPANASQLAGTCKVLRFQGFTRKNEEADDRRQRLSKPPPSASRPPHRKNCKYTMRKELPNHGGPCPGPGRNERPATSARKRLEKTVASVSRTIHTGSSRDYRGQVGDRFSSTGDSLGDSASACIRGTCSIETRYTHPRVVKNTALRLFCQEVPERYEHRDPRALSTVLAGMPSGASRSAEGP